MRGYQAQDGVAEALQVILPTPTSVNMSSSRSIMKRALERAVGALSGPAVKVSDYAKVRNEDPALTVTKIFKLHIIVKYPLHVHLEDSLEHLL